METTVVYWDYMEIVEKKMETTINCGLGFIPWALLDGFDLAPRASAKETQGYPGIWGGTQDWCSGLLYSSLKNHTHAAVIPGGGRV